MIQMNKKQKDLQTYGCWRGRIVREFGIDMYTLLCSKWKTSKDLLHGKGNSAQCDVAAWMGWEVWGRIGKNTQVLFIFNVPTIWTSTTFHWLPRESCDLGTGATGERAQCHFEASGTNGQEEQRRS